MVNHPTYRVKILKNRYQHLLYLGKAACLFLILQKYTDLNRFRNQNKYFKRPWKSDRSLFLLFELKTVRFLLQMSSLVWLKSQKVVKWKKNLISSERSHTSSVFGEIASFFGNWRNTNCFSKMIFSKMAVLVQNYHFFWYMPIFLRYKNIENAGLRKKW